MELTHKDLLNKIAEWIQEKKAADIDIIDITGKSSCADTLIICSGSGELHTRAIAEHVIDQAKEEKILMLGREGLDNASWILIDFGEAILHIFKDDIREYYDLEDLWRQRTADFKRIPTDYD